MWTARTSTAARNLRFSVSATAVRDQSPDDRCARGTQAFVDVRIAEGSDYIGRRRSRQSQSGLASFSELAAGKWADDLTRRPAGTGACEGSRNAEGRTFAFCPNRP